MLKETVFRTRDVAAADRFDCWRELMVKTVCPMDMSSDNAAGFQADARVFEIGAVRIWPTSLTPTRWQRTPKLIRQSDPEFYHLSLPLQGTIGISQAGFQALHGPYEMYVTDTSQPWDCLSGTNGAMEGIGLEVPKNLLPLSPDRIAPLLTRRLSGREGTGALLAGLLTGLAQQAGTLRQAGAPAVERSVTDLLAATLAHHLEADDCLAPETRTQVLNRHIRAFIRRHLDDPGLTPPVIAAAHHISVSYLHRLFQNEGETVAGWIRGQRLQRAQRDLTDPALRHLPIHRIAARTGFTQSTVFIRTFQAAYGRTPGDYRRQTLNKE